MCTVSSPISVLISSPPYVLISSPCVLISSPPCLTSINIMLSQVKNNFVLSGLPAFFFQTSFKDIVGLFIPWGLFIDTHHFYFSLSYCCHCCFPVFLFLLFSLLSHILYFYGLILYRREWSWYVLKEYICCIFMGLLRRQWSWCVLKEYRCCIFIQLYSSWCYQTTWRACWKLLVSLETWPDTNLSVISFLNKKVRPKTMWHLG